MKPKVYKEGDAKSCANCKYWNNLKDRGICGNCMGWDFQWKPYTKEQEKK